MNPNKIVWSEEKAKIKSLPFKEKLRYIWMYFWIPIVAIVFVLAFGTFLIVRIATNIPDNWLMVTFANTYADAGTGSRLWWIPVNLFFHVFPLYLTYSDPQLMPLYAFCWFFFGFGAIVMLTARLLIKDYNKYLPIVDDFGDFILTKDGKQIMLGSPEEKALYEDGGDSFGGHEMTDEEMIKELEKLDM